MSKIWTVKGFVRAFVEGTLGKKRKEGNYSVEGASLWYTAKHERIEEGCEELAVRLESGVVLSNADKMEYCGSYMAWGKRISVRNSYRGNGQAPAQVWLEEAGARPVPFSVFTTVGIKVHDVKIIEASPSENVTLKVQKVASYTGPNQAAVYKTTEESRHYVGACLMEAGSQYLFDIDRQELEHGIFNPFVVKLPKLAYEVATIDEAYRALVPEKVVDAKQKGTPVLRQGEWFFIKRFDTLPGKVGPSEDVIARFKKAPHALDFGGTINWPGYNPGEERGVSFNTPEDEAKYTEAIAKWQEAKTEYFEASPRAGQLQNGDTRPNTAEKYWKHEGRVLVSGKIEHSGRQHHPITLEGWWEAIPNTAVGAWQVTGDID